MRVCVGSENPAKLQAVRLGLTPFFENLELTAVAAPSGVSEQPIGFDEILCGARNRARRSYAEGRGSCDLGVGIEDGLIPVAGLRSGYVNLGCCVLFDGKQDATGFSSACRSATPSTDSSPRARGGSTPVARRETLGGSRRACSIGRRTARTP
jgi:inosine/xanthosine triphosphatase